MSDKGRRYSNLKLTKESRIISLNFQLDRGYNSIKNI